MLGRDHKGGVRRTIQIARRRKHQQRLRSREKKKSAEKSHVLVKGERSQSWWKQIANLNDLNKHCNSSYTLYCGVYWLHVNHQHHTKAFYYDIYLDF